ncbi:hypothetical protein HID58_071532 [Brassica napus]|uniref:Uncharacterized protein n=1 Tax=Brassica napus TaxID=3708 RepID=A0ABQ7Z1V5_BRANA|nr:hypothetical protein HID58_071532 [Brassica napus]
MNKKKKALVFLVGVTVAGGSTTSRWSTGETITHDVKPGNSGLEVFCVVLTGSESDLADLLSTVCSALKENRWPSFGCLVSIPAIFRVLDVVVNASCLLLPSVGCMAFIEALLGRMKCVAASGSLGGRDVFSVFVEFDVIVRWAVGANDKSRSETPSGVGRLQVQCANVMLIMYLVFSYVAPEWVLVAFLVGLCSWGFLVLPPAFVFFL